MIFLFAQSLYDLFKEHGLNTGSCGPWKEMEGKGKVSLSRPTPAARPKSAPSTKEDAASLWLVFY